MSEVLNISNDSRSVKINGETEIILEEDLKLDNNISNQDTKQNGLIVSNECEDDNHKKNSSLGSKKKSARKSQEKVSDVENEEKPKVRNKSRLSLSSEVKNKFKEDSNQGSIKSFFQTLSPRTQENHEEKDNRAFNCEEKKEAIDLDQDFVGVEKKSIQNNTVLVEENQGNGERKEKTSSKMANKSSKNSKSKKKLVEKSVQKKTEKKEEKIASSSSSKNKKKVSKVLQEEEIDSVNEGEGIQEDNQKECVKDYKKVKLSGVPLKPQSENPKFNESKESKTNEENIEVIKISSEVDEIKINTDEKSIEQAKNKIKNAFTFMMDSRHKSIGQNSPGKEQENSEEIPEVHKETKKKLSSRKAAFEEWANAKGAKKRKLEDEEKGIVIESKLKKRGKRLKKMLTGKKEVKKQEIKIIESNSEQIQELEDLKRKRKSTSKVLDQENETLDEEIFLKRKKTKLLISSDNSNSGDNLILEEATKKTLSASLQQTELSSFFGFLEKSNKSQPKNSENPKTLKKKKSKLTLKRNKDPTDDLSNPQPESQKEIQERNTNLILTPNSIKQWKMKLKFSLENVDDEEIEQLIRSPKTKTESDDDDESELIQKRKKKLVMNLESDSDEEPLSTKKYYKEKSIKPIKLAPLFIKAKGKPKFDEATIEARRKFLHSSIPDSLKKTIVKQQRVEEEPNYQIFPTISHVTIKPTPEDLIKVPNFWDLPKVELNLTRDEFDPPSVSSLKLGGVTSSTVLDNPEINLEVPNKIKNIKNYLNQIKIENPNYPVYKTFKFLYQKHLKEIKIPEIKNPETTPSKKPKRGRPKKKKPDITQTEIPLNVSKQEIWTDLYRPNTSEVIFGNTSSISKFKTWLQTWLEFSEEINMQRSKRKRRNSDSSDFESTDAESKDATRLPGNTIIFSGPHGSGKTTAVYALCNEVGINVLELNSSSKRTGKRLLQELQEATQSHQVRKNDSNPLATFLKKEETKSSQNSQGSDSSSSQKMCLLLIEDVDIVFEQDENFIPALSQLLLTSKRPVVLTTTDINCLHLKKFVAQYPVINFSNFSPKILATWLQILCLIEGLNVDRETIVELLDWNKGDARRSLLQLQFWVQSGGQSKHETWETKNVSKSFSSDEILCQDDNSNISWFEETGTEEEIKTLHTNCLESFGYFKKLFTSCPVDLGNVWWNIPELIKIPSPLIFKRNEGENNLIVKKEVKTESKDLKNVLNIFETLAITDTIYQKLNIDCDLEPVHRSREKVIKNSLELNESMENYSSNRDLACEWSHTLLDGYLNLYDVDKNLKDSYIGETKGWRTTQNKCDEVLLEAVPIICRLDQNSVNTDYLSTIRTMARSEVVRASNNIKRRNRFYNYLRGIRISCNDSLVQTACNTFQHE